MHLCPKPFQMLNEKVLHRETVFSFQKTAHKKRRTFLILIKDLVVYL